jgi:hypothetical protein
MAPNVGYYADSFLSGTEGIAEFHEDGKPLMLTPVA